MEIGLTGVEGVVEGTPLIGKEIGEGSANSQLSKEGDDAVGSEILLDRLMDSGGSDVPIFTSWEME